MALPKKEMMNVAKASTKKGKVSKSKKMGRKGNMGRKG